MRKQHTISPQHKPQQPTMVRKSKQAGGNFPLTHYERTQKFASSAYGTTTARLAGHSQYQLGDCGLTLTELTNDSTVVSPSGYLYSKESIYEYLLAKTQEIKEQQALFDRQQDAQILEAQNKETRKRLEAFDDSQKVVKKHKSFDEREVALQDLKRTSYWLADSQPEAAKVLKEAPAERPSSPHSGLPLRRKDLWPVELIWSGDEGDKKRVVVCSVSGNNLSSEQAFAYWTDKQKPGHVVSSTVIDMIEKDGNRCPTTSKKIKYTRKLQKSGSSFAASSQNVQVKQYRPTIT